MYNFSDFNLMIHAVAYKNDNAIPIDNNLPYFSFEYGIKSKEYTPDGVKV